MTEEMLLERLLSYNWDDGFDEIEDLLSGPDCTYNLALLAFWLADGYGFLTSSNESLDSFWKLKLASWCERLLSDYYPVGKIFLDIPLTKLQIYQLKKAYPTYPKKFWLGNPHR